MSLDVTGIEERPNTRLGHSLRVYPNPVTASAVISYSLSQGSAVNCIVYNAAGDVVARLQVRTLPPGEHRLTWDATGVGPGVYFCRLAAGGSATTARLNLVR